MEKGRGKGTDTLQTDNVYTRKEYIEREAALAVVNDWRDQLIPTYGENDEYVKCLETVAEHLELLHAADVAPVRHGKWIRKRTVEHEGEWYCSICGKDMLYTWGPGCGLADYCPHCGARMDGE